MNDLLAKLEAAIAETERIALAAPGKAWTRDAQGHAPKVVVVDDGTGDGFVGHGFTDEAAEHFVHNDPDRVLRRVARDRKLLAMLKIDEDGDIESVEVPGETLCDDWCIRIVGQHLLRLLAEDYEMEVES